jgi:ATP-dependent RNA circularization protein (DNA/RNA ligase family)
VQIECSLRGCLLGLWQPSWNEVELFRTAEMYRTLSAVKGRDRGVVVKGVDGVEVVDCFPRAKHRHLNLKLGRQRQFNPRDDVDPATAA